MRVRGGHAVIASGTTVNSVVEVVPGIHASGPELRSGPFFSFIAAPAVTQLPFVVTVNEPVFAASQALSFEHAIPLAWRRLILRSRVFEMTRPLP